MPPLLATGRKESLLSLDLHSFCMPAILVEGMLRNFVAPLGIRHSLPPPGLPRTQIQWSMSILAVVAASAHGTAKAAGQCVKWSIITINPNNIIWSCWCWKTLGCTSCQYSNVRAKERWPPASGLSWYLWNVSIFRLSGRTGHKQAIIQLQEIIFVLPQFLDPRFICGLHISSLQKLLNILSTLFCYSEDGLLFKWETGVIREEHNLCSMEVAAPMFHGLHSCKTFPLSGVEVPLSGCQHPAPDRSHSYPTGIGLNRCFEHVKGGLLRSMRGRAILANSAPLLALLGLGSFSLQPLVLGLYESRLLKSHVPA
ncbi:hypothetical protein Pelo_9475 [Pelomyxa schiedti]|nr:hypothetical protein Pelo_9475 [Pelomyxa schiedti]